MSLLPSPKKVWDHTKSPYSKRQDRIKEIKKFFEEEYPYIHTYLTGTGGIYQGFRNKRMSIRRPYKADAGSSIEIPQEQLDNDTTENIAYDIVRTMTSSELGSNAPHKFPSAFTSKDGKLEVHDQAERKRYDRYIECERIADRLLMRELGIEPSDDYNDQIYEEIYENNHVINNQVNQKLKTIGDPKFDWLSNRDNLKKAKLVLSEAIWGYLGDEDHQRLDEMIQELRINNSPQESGAEGSSGGERADNYSGAAGEANEDEYGGSWYNPDGADAKNRSWKSSGGIKLEPIDASSLSRETDEYNVDKIVSFLDPRLVKGTGIEKVADWRMPRKTVHHLHPKVLLPSYKTGTEDKEQSGGKLSFAVCCDISGSVSWEDRMAFRQICYEIAEEAKYETVFILAASKFKIFTQDQLANGKNKEFDGTFIHGSGFDSSLGCGDARWKMPHDESIIAYGQGEGRAAAMGVDYAVERGLLSSYPESVLFITDGQTYIPPGFLSEEHAKGWRQMSDIKMDDFTDYLEVSKSGTYIDANACGIELKCCIPNENWSSSQNFKTQRRTSIRALGIAGAIKRS